MLFHGMMLFSRHDDIFKVMITAAKIDMMVENFVELGSFEH